MDEQLFSAATCIVEDAGKMLRAHFGKVQVLKKKSESAKDAVTQLDLQVEAFIATELHRLDPTIGFLGEEWGIQHTSERMWLVDPIDGTTHFIRGIPLCTTMIALVDKGNVVFSLIYDFVRRDLYRAEKGRGATLNGRPIAVSQRPLRDAYISVETNLDYAGNLRPFLHLREHAVVLHTVTSGFEFGLIASGKLEGRICLDPYGDDWDYAAGSLLVQEAGGIVANIGKETYQYHNHNFMAVNRVIYEELTGGNDPLFPIMAPRTIQTSVSS